MQSDTAQYQAGFVEKVPEEVHAKMMQEIMAIDASLVAITPELPDESLSTIEKNELDF